MTAVRARAASLRPAGWPGFAGIGLALAGLIIAVGNIDVPKGEQGGTGPAIFTAALCVLVTAVLYTVLLRIDRRGPRIMLMLGIASILSVAAFWSGVTPVLAAATLWCARPNAVRGRAVTTARGLAVAATLISVGASLAGSLL